MATDFVDICNEFASVMDLDAYDPVKHDGLLNKMEVLGLTLEEKQLKSSLNDVITSFKEYVQDLKTSSSNVNTNKKICTYDFRQLKARYSECSKGDNDENGTKVEETVPKEDDAVVKTIDVSTQIGDCLDDVKGPEDTQLVEKNKELEKEVERLKSELKQREGDLEELYKKYANENDSKVHNESVFKLYVEERNKFVKTVKEKALENLEKFDILTERVTSSFENVLEPRSDR